MDNKGIEIPGMGPPMLSQVRLEPKQITAIQPITSVDKGSFQEIKENDPRQEQSLHKMSPEEQAKEATEIIKERLADKKGIEVSWRFESKFGELVVQIKDPATGKILRQVPPKDILTAASDPKFDPAGLLLNKTA